MNYFLECHNKAQSLDVVRLARQNKTGSACEPLLLRNIENCMGFSLPFYQRAAHTPQDPTPLLLCSGSQTFSSAGGLTSPAAIVSMAPSECPLC